MINRGDQYLPVTEFVMSESHSPAQPPIHWFDDPQDVPADVADWLMEMGSMTRRFEKRGVAVTGQPEGACFVSREEPGESGAQQRPGSARCSVREVVLFGDEAGWVLGRTVTPEEAL